MGDMFLSILILSESAIIRIALASLFEKPAPCLEGTGQPQGMRLGARTRYASAVHCPWIFFLENLYRSILEFRWNNHSNSGSRVERATRLLTLCKR